jgi:hypothetical protein
MALPPLLVMVIVTAGCGKGDDTAESTPKKSRPTTTTSVVTTTTTLTREQVYTAMNDEITRSCNEAYISNKPPSVMFDPAWSDLGSQGELLDRVEECLSIRRGENTTTTSPPSTTVPVTRVIRGTLALYQDKFVSKGCSGYDGYSDIVIGASVTIRNGSGTIIATTTLSGCRFTNVRTDTFPAIPGVEGIPGVMDPIPGTPATTEQSGFMAFDFTASDVPDSDFYTVEVSHRGQISFSKADLERAGWVAQLSLGP